MSSYHDQKLAEADKRLVKAAATPLVRKLAAQYNVDLSALKGTGAGGRISKSDVLTAAVKNLQRRPANLAAPSVSPPDANAPRVTGSDGRFERIEYGREPTQQEKLDDFEYRLTGGGLGERAPEHIVYYRDTSGPRLIDHPDGTAHWALPGE